MYWQLSLKSAHIWVTIRVIYSKLAQDGSSSLTCVNEFVKNFFEVDINQLIRMYVKTHCMVQPVLDHGTTRKCFYWSHTTECTLAQGKVGGGGGRRVVTRDPGRWWVFLCFGMLRWLFLRSETRRIQWHNSVNFPSQKISNEGSDKSLYSIQTIFLLFIFLWLNGGQGGARSHTPRLPTPHSLNLPCPIQTHNRRIQCVFCTMRNKASIITISDISLDNFL